MSNYFHTLTILQILQWSKDNKRLKVKSDIPQSYLCSKCKDILIDAIQTECGCRYCLLCFHEHFGAGNRFCVNQLECKNANITDSFLKDNAANREILKMIVKCPFNRCNDFIKITNLKAHMLQCSYMEDRCSKCLEYYPQKQEESHINDSCVKRLVKCNFCETSLSYDILMKDHYNFDNESVCRNYEAECPNGCGIENLYNHRKICQNRLVSCPFPECEMQVTKKRMNDHLAENCDKHLHQFVKESLTKYSNIEKLEDEIKAKEITLNKLKKSLDKLKKDQLKKFDSQRDTIENASFNTTKSVIFRKGTLIWKVERFSEIKASAESGNDNYKLSEPFYSNEFGYKLCIKIYPLGDGSGYRTHLSVYFVIMKGEYDEIISWPFKNKVTLSLLSSKNIYSENFKPDPSSICYKKPSLDSNIASGSPKFIKFEELAKFIIEDSFYIKITVSSN